MAALLVVGLDMSGSIKFSTVSRRGCLKALLLSAGSLSGEYAVAEAVEVELAAGARAIVDGGQLTIDGSVAPDSYEVKNGGVLNLVDNAQAIYVESKNSIINTDSGTITAGLSLSDSVATITRSVVRNDTGVGLFLIGQRLAINPGSWAFVSSSDITGSGRGISAGAYSSLLIENSRVTGYEDAQGQGFGIRIGSGKATVQGSSEIRGDLNGLRIIDGSEGVTAIGFERETQVVIDHSIIEGITGAAINVGTMADHHAIASITLQNNSTLLSGNGNLLEVEKSSIVNFTVDHSLLTGNLVADDTSTMNVTLQNGSQLTGNVVNGNNLAIHSGAEWQMLGDSAVNSMSLNGGLVSFGGEGFRTLSLGALSGSGTFAMEIDLDTGLGDLLEVKGQATGDFKLDIQNTGVETVSPDIQPLQVVHTEGGDAQFSLLGGRVDLGAYSYLLEQQGNDWFIVGNGKTISPSTQSALALFNAAPNIWMSELSTLRSRMGEVRGTGQGGGWIRGYGNRFDATTGAGIDYKQRQNGFSFGADAPVPVSEGQLVVGLLGGYSKSDLDISRGTTGEVDSYYVGAYGTWLSDEGYYLDAVLKLNKFHNDSKVAMSDYSKAKGDYKNTGVGGSVEFGKHIKLADDFFVEPYTQLAAVVVQGDNYTLDNGLEAKNSRTQSVLGKVGSSVGRNIALKDGGVLQPYLRAAVAHEFARSNKVEVNDTRFNNDLFGSRAELGVGVSVSLSNHLQVHADFDYMKGDHVEQPWGANVGVRYAF
ncbi:MAG: outer rane autotransporter [Pseudomonas sp.]|nr:outer rane autotransporter [Pseudomonas sp.]